MTTDNMFSLRAIAAALMLVPQQWSIMLSYIIEGPARPMVRWAGPAHGEHGPQVTSVWTTASAGGDLSDLFTLRSLARCHTDKCFTTSEMVSSLLFGYHKAGRARTLINHTTPLIISLHTHVSRALWTPAQAIGSAVTSTGAI